MKIRHSWRYYAAELTGWLSDFFLSASCWFAGYREEEPDENRSDALLRSIQIHHEYPCPDCEGRGFKITADDDAYICPSCLGSKLDLRRLILIVKGAKL